MDTIGRIFRVSTFGESHGKAVGCIVDGCPAGLELSVLDVQRELDRRRPGQSQVTTSRSECDEVKILSGVYDGKATGTAISMIVENQDADYSKYDNIRDTPRPGHADLTYRMKFGHVDHRGGGRASARETIGRVAAGAVAKKALEGMSIQSIAYTKAIGKITSDETAKAAMKGMNDLIDSNPVRALDQELAGQMEKAVLDAKSMGDSVGGIVEVVTFGLPGGVGEPVFGKLTSALAYALASIPAVRGVEFGQGFAAAKMLGSQSNDSFEYKGDKVVTKTNNCGGMLGGISTGMPLIVRVAFKPTASISKVQESVDLLTKENTKIKVDGRHDPCVVPRAVPVVEAMVNIVLVDMLLIGGFMKRKSTQVIP